MAAERESEYRENSRISIEEQLEGKTPAQKRGVIRNFINAFKDFAPGSGASVMRRLEAKLNNNERVSKSDPGYVAGKGALFSLFEAVRTASVVLGLTAADMGLNRNNVAVLIREIDGKVGPYLGDTTDTVHLYNFIRKFNDTDFDENQWRTEWAALKPKLTRNNLERVRDAIKTTHEKPGGMGQLNISGAFDINTEFAVAEDDGRQPSVPMEVNDDVDAQTSKINRRLQSLFGAHDITDNPPPLNNTEVPQYNNWHGPIEDFLRTYREAQQPSPTDTDDIKKTKRTKLDAFEKYERDLESARLTGNVNKLKSAIQSLSSIGLIMPSDFEHNEQKYIEYYRRSMANERQDEFLKTFGITKKEINDLQPNTIYDRFDDYFETKDGKTALSKAGMDKLYSAFYQTMNRVLSRTTLAGDPQNTASSNEYRLNSSINQLIWNIVEDPRIRSKLETREGGLGNYSLFRDFVTNTFLEARFQEQKIRSFYNRMVTEIIEGKATPDSLAASLKDFRASEVNFVMKGYKSSITQLAVSAFERDLQNRIAVKNKGVIPSDLFARAKVDLTKEYQYEDFWRVRDNFAKEIRSMQNDPQLRESLKGTEEGRKLLQELEHIEEWEVDRAMGIAMGVSFINSMRGHDIIAMGKPPEHFKALFPFAQYFSLDKKWRVGRGGEQWKTSELLQLEIRMKEDKRGLSERIKQGWVPKVLWEKGRSAERMAMDKLIEQLNNNTLKLAQSKEDHVFLSDLFRQFSTFSLFTQGGWRIAALGDWYKTNVGQAMDADWRATYDNLKKRVGAGSRFFYDNARVEAEVKHYILTKHFGPNYKTEQKQSVLDATFNEYMLMPNKGKLNEKEMFKYNNDDKENNLSTYEFIEEKAFFYRGMNFLALMERSPYDFMLNIVQLEPELATTVTISNEIPGKDRKELTAWEFYFDDSILPYLNKVELANREEWRKRIDARWTDPNKKDEKGNIDKTNVNHIKKLAEVWHKVYTNNNFKKAQKQPDGSTKLVLDKSGAADKFFFIMSRAADKVKLTDKEAMTKEDILQPSDDGNDKASEALAEIILGQDGMVTYFKGLNEKFADKEGEEVKVGDRKFFYALAKRWYEYDQRGVVPNTNEMKVGPLFETIGAHEEEAYSRMWGSNKNWNEAVNGITDFDNILLRAASSKNLSEIMELHKKIQGLEGSLGPTGAHRLNYILATAVVRFFQQDYRARFPFPLNMFTAWGLEKEMSLSVRHKSTSAMQWKEESIREYMDSLLTAGYIGKDGYWTREMLEKSVGADREKYFVLSAGPSIAFLTILTIAAQFFMHSFSTYGPGAKKK